MPSRLSALLVATAVTLTSTAAASSATTMTTLACAPLGTPTQSETITVGNAQRSYLLHVPAHPLGERLPLVLAFHGRGETPAVLEHDSGLDRLHAVLVYPRGEPGTGGKLSWSGTPTAAPGVDDVQFARTIVAALRGWSCVDPGRTYATGKSDGGGVAWQLACRAADLVLAIAPVAGAYYPIAGGCRPARPVSILEFHGTDDRVVPAAGSARRGLPDIQAWLAAWARRDGCTVQQPEARIGRDVRLWGWSGCAAGSQVAGYRILHGGHTWPAIDATALIARFFGVSVSR